MKRLFIFLILIIVSSYCFSLGRTEVQEKLPRINKVVLNNWGKLNIEKGDENKLQIKTSEYLHSKMKTQIFGDTLVLSIEGIQTGLNRSAINYHLFLRDLSSIENRSTGIILVQSAAVEELSLIVSSSGDITCEKITGGSLAIDISGSGNITVDSGDVGLQRINLSGTGDYSAGNLKSGVSLVLLSGPGKGEIWVTGSLDAVVTGGGDLSYYGDPEIARAESPGSGTILPLGEK